MVKVLSMSHHRNGIGGDPFDVAIFEDDDGTVKVAVDFGGSAFAVLQVDKLSAGDIAFGSNSWRGDQYAGRVRPLMESADISAAPGALCVVWPKRQG